MELKLRECTEAVQKKRQDLNVLINSEVDTLTQDLHVLEQKTRRVYNKGMSFLNNFCAEVDKCMARLVTQGRVVDRLLDRIRPIVSADVIKQANRLRDATLVQQQRWYDLDDKQDGLSRRQKRNARRGKQLSVDQVRGSSESHSLCPCHAKRV